MNKLIIIALLFFQRGRISDNISYDDDGGGGFFFIIIIILIMGALVSLAEWIGLIKKKESTRNKYDHNEEMKRERLKPMDIKENVKKQKELEEAKEKSYQQAKLQAERNKLKLEALKKEQNEYERFALTFRFNKDFISRFENSSSPQKSLEELELTHSKLQKTIYYLTEKKEKNIAIQARLAHSEFFQLIIEKLKLNIRDLRLGRLGISILINKIENQQLHGHNLVIEQLIKLMNIVTITSTLDDYDDSYGSEEGIITFNYTRIFDEDRYKRIKIKRLPNDILVINQLEELLGIAVKLSELSDTVNNVDYEEKQKLIKDFKNKLEQVPNMYK